MKNSLTGKLLSILCSILFTLTACQGLPAEPAPLDQNAELTLSLYCMDTDFMVDAYIGEFERDYRNITIEKKAFDDTAQLDEVLASELNAGKGPDIAIFSANTKLDVIQMAKNGSFASLNPFIAQAERPIKYENYITSVFDTGKVGGEQYIIPLSIYLSTLYYNLDDSHSFTPAPVLSFQDFQAAFYRDMEEEDRDGQSALLMHYGLTLLMLQASQLIQYSEDGKQILYDKEKLRELVAFIADMQTEYNDNSAPLVSKYGNSYVDAVKHFKYVYFTSSDFIDSSNSLNRINKTVNGSDMGLSVLTGYDTDTVSAIVGSYGIVNKNSGNKAAYAYEFLRTAIDYYPQPSRSSRGYPTISRYKLYEQIIQAKSPAKSISYDGIEIKGDGLDDRLAQDLTTIVDSITQPKIVNPKLIAIFGETFEPYFKGSATYDTCLADFEQRINLYLTE